MKTRSKTRSKIKARCLAFWGVDRKNLFCFVVSPAPAGVDRNN
nr:MAG TPA: hypothetical protein [Caudoviricetes sp.]